MVMLMMCFVLPSVSALSERAWRHQATIHAGQAGRAGPADLRHRSMCNLGVEACHDGRTIFGTTHISLQPEEEWARPPPHPAGSETDAECD